MKPHLPLTFGLAVSLASGALAHPGSRASLQLNTPIVSISAPQSAVSTSAHASPGTPPSAAGAPLGDSGSEGTAPSNPAAPETPLQISALERDYFTFGYSLSRAAFSYADIAKQSLAIQQSRDRMTQIKLLAGLAPAADRDRSTVRENLNCAVEMMRTLHASRLAFRQVSSAAEGLNRPIAIEGGAKDLSALSPDAGRTLASLNEFERISGLTQSPEVAAWLKGRHANKAGNVWYAEGLIAGVAEVASDQNMPELLPNVGEIATDLRGLRDWLLLRMPDPPSARQAALNLALDQFLRSTSSTRRQNRPVTQTELVALGNISRQLQAQVLLRDSASTTAMSTGASPQVADSKKSL